MNTLVVVSYTLLAVNHCRKFSFHAPSDNSTFEGGRYYNIILYVPNSGLKLTMCNYKLECLVEYALSCSEFNFTPRAVMVVLHH